MERECEAFLEPLERQLALATAGWVKRGYFKFMATYIKNNSRTCVTLNAFRQMSPDLFIHFLRRRQEFVQEIAQKWQQEGLTAILGPILPHCAYKASTLNEHPLEISTEYSDMWNVTGFPAGILPVTRVMPYEQNFTDHHTDMVTEVLHSDTKGSADMPVCLQLVGYAFDDEKVLGIMKVLEERLSSRSQVFSKSQVHGKLLASKKNSQAEAGQPVEGTPS